MAGVIASVVSGRAPPTYIDRCFAEAEVPTPLVPAEATWLDRIQLAARTQRLWVEAPGMRIDAVQCAAARVAVERAVCAAAVEPYAQFAREWPALLEGATVPRAQLAATPSGNNGPSAERGRPHAPAAEPPQPPSPAAAPLRVLYCHGLESGPNGFKVESMRVQGLDVVAPDMGMSLLDPRASNGVLRQLLRPSVLFHRPPWQWLGGAVCDSFEACVAVQRAALTAMAVPAALAAQPPTDSPSELPSPPDPCHAASHGVDVLVGSSWGGAVAAALLAEGCWQGPTVLLCPGLRSKDRWAADAHSGAAMALTADTITARLAALPMALKARCLLVHGTKDSTIPLADSTELAAATGIALEIIEGGSHGLGSIVRDGRLAGFIRRVARVGSE